METEKGTGLLRFRNTWKQGTGSCPLPFHVGFPVSRVGGLVAALVTVRHRTAHWHVASGVEVTLLLGVALALTAAGTPSLAVRTCSSGQVKPQPRGRDCHHSGVLFAQPA